MEKKGGRREGNNEKEWEVGTDGRKIGLLT
jgi:hypothetical protein